VVDTRAVLVVDSQVVQCMEVEQIGQLQLDITE
jgi:hypothetical protein